MKTITINGVEFVITEEQYDLLGLFAMTYFDDERIFENNRAYALILQARQFGKKTFADCWQAFCNLPQEHWLAVFEGDV